MKRGKRAQFYLIAAAIIIFILVSLATISNYISVRKEPQKLYDIGDVLQREGAKVVEYATINGTSSNILIQRYLSVYRSYLETNLNEDFDLIIFYGGINLTGNSISASRFTRASLGDISISIPGGTTYVTGGTNVVINNSEWSLTTNQGQKIVNVTIISNRTGQGFSTNVPILPDNNFVFVMTSSDGFNNYIRTSFNNLGN
jgi:hypothetical protein